LPGDVWGPAEVGGEDCRIVCSGGEVAAHSAILAGASPFLASLLFSPGACHCTSARSIHLPGVGVAEVQALVQLLSTGQAPLPNAAPAPPTAPLVRLLSLADVLGLSLTGLTARTSQGRVIHIQEQSKDDRSTACLERSKTPPLPDSQKFRRNSQQQEMVKVRRAAGLDGDPRRSKVLGERGEDLQQRAQKSEQRPGQSRRCDELSEKTQSFKSVERLGEEIHLAKAANEREGGRRQLKSPENGPANTFAKPSLLTSRKTKLLPSVQNPQHSFHFPFLRPRSPNSPPPGPQARVIMSDTALIDLMDIKKEVVDDEVVAELEGREEELSEEGDEEEYPDMDNYGRNYVCCKCAKGFTFAKSFNWHTSRCEGGESRGRGTENSLGKREASDHKISGNGDSQVKKKIILGKEKVESGRDKTPLRQRSVTPQAKERTGISKGEAAKKAALPKRERSITPRGKVILSKIQMAGPSPRRKGSEKKIQLKKRINGRSESKSPPEKKPMRKNGKSNRSSPETRRQRNQDAPSKVAVCSTLGSNRGKGGLIRKKIDLAKKVALKKSQQEVAAAIGRPVRGSCGRCVKCRMPDCGKCPACVGGNTVQGLRGCVRKVCRNKGRRSVRGST